MSRMRTFTYAAALAIGVVVLASRGSRAASAVTTTTTLPPPAPAYSLAADYPLQLAFDRVLAENAKLDRPSLIVRTARPLDKFDEVIEECRFYFVLDCGRLRRRSKDLRDCETNGKDADGCRFSRP